MLDLVRKHGVQVSDHGIGHDEATGWTVHALAEPAEIRRLRDAGYSVQRHEDVDKWGRARMQEVGRGDRYRERGRPSEPDAE
jgi:hypothetical protein